MLTQEELEHELSTGYNCFQNHEYFRAIKSFSRVIKQLKLSPELARGSREEECLLQSFQQRALCWIQQEEYDIALLDINDGLRECPCEPSLYFVRGHINMKSGEHYDKAVHDFSKVLELEQKAEKRSAALFERCRALVEIKRYEQALSDNDAVFKGNENNTDVVQLRLRILAGLGRFSEASELGEKYMRQTSDLSEEFFLIMNEIYTELKDWDNAALTRSKINSPTKDIIRFDLIKVHNLIDQKKYTEALNYTESFLINEENSEALFTRGEVYFLLERFENAQSDWKRALELNPSD
ncbi:MAG: tetratricopeptide repeat protein, partial [Fibrobacter sp.]|nr:tetratricopeptide repeat protein [Fibrobacter sp.]